MKTWKITLGSVLVPILLIGGCAGRAWQRDETAKRFCASLIPRIEQAKAKKGLYPQQADPTWWAGQSVPSLISTQQFYIVKADGFGFWFQDDSWVFDNVWDFDNSSKQWSSYDANYATK